MWRQLGNWAAFAAAIAVAAVLMCGRALWRAIRHLLIVTLQVLAALILVFEEWGWRPLTNAVARLARYQAWAKLELIIAGLPPYGALLALLLPTSILFPLKIAALWLLAKGHAISAAALLFGAKIASTGLIARIFILTKPALMQIGWFARAYERFVPWKEALLDWIRSSWPWRYGRIIKSRVKRAATAAWRSWRPWLVPRALRLRLMAERGWRAVRRRMDALRGRLADDTRRLLRRDTRA